MMATHTDRSEEQLTHVAEHAHSVIRPTMPSPEVIAHSVAACAWDCCIC